MRNSKKSFGCAGQSTTETKKPQKRDVNLQKNSSLYFQIGLILCLLATYGLFEMQFQTKIIIPDPLEINEVATIDVVPLFREEIIPSKEPEPFVERSTELKDIYEVVDDTKKVLETKIITTDEGKTVNEPLDPNSLTSIDKTLDDPVFVPFVFIEVVPIFPGCEKFDTNDDRRKCMSKKISKFVNKKFNTDIGSQYGMHGKLKIDTQFTIDKTGNIIDIKARAPHASLEKEAERVINKIPKMKPGYQMDKPVGVIYTLPILFYVQD